jgi:hypothetical protein
MRRNFGAIKERTPMSSTATKQPIPMTPELAALTALVMPLVQMFVAEISRLPPPEQTKRIDKALAGMRADEPVKAD